MAGWESVVLQDFAGRTERGLASGFDPSTARIVLYAAGRTAPLEVPLASIRLVFFVHQLELAPEARRIPDRMPPTTPPIELVLVDGGVIRGHAAGAVPAGYFVTLPVDVNAHTIFVPVGALGPTVPPPGIAPPPGLDLLLPPPAAPPPRTESSVVRSPWAGPAPWAPPAAPGAAPVPGPPVAPRAASVPGPPVAPRAVSGPPVAVPVAPVAVPVAPRSVSIPAVAPRARSSAPGGVEPSGPPRGAVLPVPERPVTARSAPSLPTPTPSSPMPAPSSVAAPPARSSEPRSRPPDPPAERAAYDSIPAPWVLPGGVELDLTTGRGEDELDDLDLEDPVESSPASAPEAETTAGRRVVAPPRDLLAEPELEEGGRADFNFQIDDEPVSVDESRLSLPAPPQAPAVPVVRGAAVPDEKRATLDALWGGESIAEALTADLPQRGRTRR